MTQATNERLQDAEEMMRSMMEGFLATVQTAMPGLIISFNAAACTVRVQPAIMVSQRKPDGSAAFVPMTVLDDVPVHFPGGGGMTSTFPIAAGDECLLVFGSRCMDGWWAQGGIQPPLDPRMHNLSDAYAICGIRSKARPLANISTTTAQWRSDDGSTYAEIAPDHSMKFVAPAGLTIISPLTTVEGDMVIIGSTGGPGTATFHGTIRVDGDVVAGEGTSAPISLLTHRHTGVLTGGGTSGTPTP